MENMELGIEIARNILFAIFFANILRKIALLSAGIIHVYNQLTAFCPAKFICNVLNIISFETKF